MNLSLLKKGLFTEKGFRNQLSRVRTRRQGSAFIAPLPRDNQRVISLGPDKRKSKNRFTKRYDVPAPGEDKKNADERGIGVGKIRMRIDDEEHFLDMAWRNWNRTSDRIMDRRKEDIKWDYRDPFSSSRNFGYILNKSTIRAPIKKPIGREIRKNKREEDALIYQEAIDGKYPMVLHEKSAEIKRDTARKKAKDLLKEVREREVRGTEVAKAKPLSVSAAPPSVQASPVSSPASNNTPIKSAQVYESYDLGQMALTAAGGAALGAGTSYLTGGEIGQGALTGAMGMGAVAGSRSIMRNNSAMVARGIGQLPENIQRPVNEWATSHMTQNSRAALYAGAGLAGGIFGGNRRDHSTGTNSRRGSKI